jgi:hypothetical protein
MQISYKDFAPMVARRSFMKVDVETFASVVKRANRWIAENQIRLLNVETVVSELSDSPTPGVMPGLALLISGSRRQELRVWFETPESS